MEYTLAYYVALVAVHVAFSLTLSILVLTAFLAPEIVQRVQDVCAVQGTATAMAGAALRTQLYGPVVLAAKFFAALSASYPPRASYFTLPACLVSCIALAVAFAVASVGTVLRVLAKVGLVYAIVAVTQIAIVFQVALKHNAGHRYSKVLLISSCS